MEISQNLLYFDIGEDKFAIKTDSLIEVIPMVEYQKNYSPVLIVRGKWVYRGKEIFIMDLKEFLGLEVESAPEIKKPSSKGSVLILNLRGKLIGLLVDRVYNIVAPRKVYPYPQMVSTLEGRYFEGISKIYDELVIILDEQNLLDNHELEVLKA